MGMYCTDSHSTVSGAACTACRWARGPVDTLDAVPGLKMLGGDGGDADELHAEDITVLDEELDASTVCIGDGGRRRVLG